MIKKLFFAVFFAKFLGCIYASDEIEIKFQDVIKAFPQLLQEKPDEEEHLIGRTFFINDKEYQIRNFLFHVDQDLLSECRKVWPEGTLPSFGQDVSTTVISYTRSSVRNVGYGPFFVISHFFFSWTPFIEWPQPQHVNFVEKFNRSPVSSFTLVLRSAPEPKELGKTVDVIQKDHDAIKYGKLTLSTIFQNIPQLKDQKASWKLFDCSKPSFIFNKTRYQLIQGFFEDPYGVLPPTLSFEDYVKGQNFLEKKAEHVFIEFLNQTFEILFQDYEDTESHVIFKLLMKKQAL